MSVTITQSLMERLDSEPDAIACHLVDATGTAQAISVRKLIERSRQFAASLPPRSEGCCQIQVCLYQGLDLLASFLGSILAGHVPSMVAPPSPRMDAAKYSRNFRQMLGHVEPDIVFTDSVVLEKLETTVPRENLKSRLILPGELVETSDFSTVFNDPDEVAIVQHSSGTTGQQKGVALSHREIMNHNKLYCECLKVNKADTIVSWLPLYHDMGFIACFMLPVTTGIPFVQMSPFDWVTKPVLLLDQIHKFHGTLCWMPNFAFSFMTDSIRESQLADGLDISSIRAWVNCSEPAYYSSMERFADRFADYGVTKNQFSVSYAMAENVFAVTQSQPGEVKVLAVNRERLSQGEVVVEDNPDEAYAYVSNGRTVAGTDLRILDEHGQATENLEDTVGEIALRGRTLFTGYFKRDDLTKAAFTNDGFYMTGDIGFIHDSEVYITGRKKDVIIIQGRNFYPSDIEEAVGDIDGIIRGRVVALGMADESNGTDKLVILAECDKDHAEETRKLSLHVRQTVAQAFDCNPGEVKILADRWLIKSTAGKLARKENREKYLAEKIARKQNREISCVH